MQEYYLRLVGHYREFIEPDTSEADAAAPSASALPAAHASSEDDGYVRCAHACVVWPLLSLCGCLHALYGQGVRCPKTSGWQMGVDPSYMGAFTASPWLKNGELTIGKCM